MFLFDFQIFHAAGHALLHGASPYTVPGFYSPLPLAVLFTPLALLPVWAAYALYLGLSAYLLWRVVDKPIWALLSFPVAFALFVGQVDLLLALSASVLGPFALPLLLAKPQIAFIAAPWLFKNADRKQLFHAIIITLLVSLFCFAIRPNWLVEWQSALSGGAYPDHPSNLYWLIPSESVRSVAALIISPLVLVAGLMLRERRDSWAVLHLLTPISNVYSAAALAEWIGPLEATVSWLVVFLWGGRIHAGFPLFIIGAVILFKHLPIDVDQKNKQPRSAFSAFYPRRHL